MSEKFEFIKTFIISSLVLASLAMGAVGFHEAFSKIGAASRAGATLANQHH